ncbi:VCBS domain-containing protein, partial [Aquimarina sp. M1]
MILFSLSGFSQDNDLEVSVKEYQSFYPKDQINNLKGNKLFLNWAKDKDHFSTESPLVFSRNSFISKSPSDPPTLDLDAITVGEDYEFFLEPTTFNVFPVTRGNAAITSDTGTISNATIIVSGNLDPSELLAINNGAGFDLYFLTGNNTFTYDFGGGIIIEVEQTGTSFVITETTNDPIPNNIFEDFLETIFYGDLTSPYTEGVRTLDITLNDTTGGSTTSQTIINVVTAPVAVDDTNNINADATVPVTGNIVTNDTDATSGGDVLSITEVNVFPGTVGGTYNTLYGSIVVQSDGSYSYTVDTDSPAVAGLVNGTILQDIFAYTVEDSTGAFDYGILTITINGIDDLPVAVDDNDSVTVNVVNTATGNVIEGNGTDGEDLLDRPLSRLIWENEFTNGTTVGGTTRTIDGVNLNFTSLDPDGIGTVNNQISANTDTNGGHTGYLLFNIDAATNSVADTQLIIDFSQEVFNLGFLVTDIDFSQGTVWQDQITIQGFSGGSPTPISYNFIRTGGIVEAGGDTYYGTGVAIPEDATGNINIAFQSPIDQLILSYNYGPDVTDANPGGQIAGISDIFWQGDNNVTIVAVDGNPLSVGNTIATTYGFLTLNSDGSYTYTLDTTNTAVQALPQGSTLIDTIPYTLRDALLSTDTANLIITINGTAADTDGDGIVDSLDDDDDNDGVLDTVENSLGVDPSGDADGDGILNYEDFTDNGSGTAPVCADNDSNGICDTLDPVFDFDQDGIPNHFDLDSDNDGVYDVVEAGGTDANQDGIADGAVDGSGVPSSASGGIAPIDTNSDGSLDFLNLDSDGDGCSDANEAYNSSSADGGDSGVYGTDPVTVDSDGLVSGASYNTGNVAAVTDSSFAKACVLDLVISKTVTDSTPDEGDTIVYTITVTNNGPIEATNISLDDVLPTGVTATGTNV